MQILIAILFYLGVITGPATYTQAEFDTMVQQNQTEIDQVQQDPVLMQMMDTLTTPQIMILGDSSEEY